MSVHESTPVPFSETKPGAVLGDRMIHLYERKKPFLHGNELTARWPESREICYVQCRYEFSEQAIYEEYAKPVVFRNQIDSHMRPRLEPFPSMHMMCGHNCFPTRSRHSDITLELLAVSRETRLEGLKQMYSTNIWSFDNPATFRLWLSQLSKESIDWVHHIHLKPTMNEVHDCPTGSWETIFNRTVLKELPNLHVINITIDLTGSVLCFRRSQGSEFINLFRPLRMLRKLKEFTLIFNDCSEIMARDSTWCTHVQHDEAAHAASPKATFWQRKETARAWAEETRRMVLDKGQE